MANEMHRRRTRLTTNACSQIKLTVSHPNVTFYEFNLEIENSAHTHNGINRMSHCVGLLISDRTEPTKPWVRVRAQCSGDFHWNTVMRVGKIGLITDRLSINRISTIDNTISCNNEVFAVILKL